MIKLCQQCQKEMQSMCPCSECAGKLSFCSEECAQKFIASLSPEERKALLEVVDEIPN